MILYIQTAFLGDLLLSIPTLKRLRQLYPDQQIHLICRKELASFFLENKLVDVAYINYKGRKPTWGELAPELSGKVFDLLVCPHESLRSNYISWRVRARYKIGFKKMGNSLVFDRRELRPLQWPEAIRQLTLLASLDADLSLKLRNIQDLRSPLAQIPDWSSMVLPELENTSKQFRKEMSLKWSVPAEVEYICLAPGSVWATKKWGDSQYQELAQKLVAQGKYVLLMGSGGERDLGEWVKNNSPRVFNLCGETTLTEMAQILALSKVLVCNDSGAMHMASAVNVPTVTMFGPTVQSFGYQPWNPKAVVVEDTQLECRPCSAHGTDVCPIKTHVCMKNLSVDRVMGEILKFP